MASTITVEGKTYRLTKAGRLYASVKCAACGLGPLAADLVKVDLDGYPRHWACRKA